MWRVRNDPIVKKKYHDTLVTKFAGSFNFYCYSNIINGTEHFALVKGDINESEETLVRVQKLNYISDLFNGRLESKNGSNHIPIERIMTEMKKNNKGVLVIIKDNNNLAELNYKNAEKYYSESQEFREYGVGAQILRDLGVRKMILLTNSKKAIIGLEGFDLKIVKHQELQYE